MDSANASAAALRKQIFETEAQLKKLKEQLAQVEATDGISSISLNSSANDPVTLSEGKWPLSKEEYRRYGRQMIVPSIGIQGLSSLHHLNTCVNVLTGQLRLKSARVLIIGAGGLGCPAAAYIAGAGVGTLGLVDGDTVELSNLHRQILHSTAKIGMLKVDSAISYLQTYLHFPSLPNIY